MTPRHLGIVAVSAEGAALCYRTRRRIDAERWEASFLVCRGGFADRGTAVARRHKRNTLALRSET